MGYSKASQHYQLGFPNQEVRQAFTESLVRHFAPLNPKLSDEMETFLEKQDLTAFFDLIQQIFSKFPYQAFSKAQEHTYHGLLLSLLSSMDLEIAAERASSLGRVDLLVQVPKTTYMIEIKLDSSPEAGLKQISKQQYHGPYLRQGKAIAIVGLSFPSETATWAGELLDEDGELIRKLAPAAQQ